MALNLAYTNNASSTTAVSITAGSATVTVAASDGAKFPSTDTTAFGTKQFYATLVSTSGLHEIVLVTARAGDVFSITRGQQTTQARSWPSGSRIELRVTAGGMDQKLNLRGGQMDGTLDMNGNNIRNPVFPDGVETNTVRTNMIIDKTGDLDFPMTFSANRRPWIDGSLILTASDFTGMVFMWSGLESNLPSIFKLCNGSNGTPDLRDRFIVSSGQTYPSGTAYPNDPNAPFIVTSSASGKHKHGGDTGKHVLTRSEIPQHIHRVDDGATIDGANIGYGYVSSGNITSTAAQDTDGGNVGTSSGAAAGHDHSISEVGDHTHTVNPPPFYALAFVMFR
jgi:hypothetical protein